MDKKEVDEKDSFEEVEDLDLLDHNELFEGLESTKE